MITVGPRVLVSRRRCFEAVACVPRERLLTAAGERCRLYSARIAVELNGEDTMKRVVLLPLLLMLAGCVTYEGVD